MRLLLQSPRLLILLIALLVVSGLGAIKSIPRMEDPNLVNRTAIITTIYPGASAERVEALVTEPLEDELRRLKNIEKITSVSRPGVSIISVFLAANVLDGGPYWSLARNYIDDALPGLPKGVAVPSLDIDKADAYTSLFALRWAGGSAADMSVLGRYARELDSRLRALSGSEYLEIYGAPNEQILVEINPDKASALGLSAAMIGNIIAAADVKLSAGEISNADNILQLEMAGSFESISQIRQTILKVLDNGTIVRVGDIATINRDIQLPQSDMVTVDGVDSIIVAARMMAGTRINDWMASVDNTVEGFKAELPSNIELLNIFDQRGYTEHRLQELVGNILLGFFFVAVVLLLTLGWRSAIVVALSLPLTLMFTLSVMQYYGLPIHQMSVIGLVVAIGIMVDNAIVMVDSIAQKRQQGHDAISAAMASLKHLWLPLLGSTLTTILAFSPIALMPGSAGEFIGGIALSVIFSLIGSYIISHTIIASLAAWFLSGQSKGEVNWLTHGAEFPVLSSLFNKSLLLSTRFPKTTIGLVLLVPLTGFGAATQLHTQFFPPSDRDMFQIELYLSPQASIYNTRAMTEQLDAVLVEEGIHSSSWTIGRSAASFYYNLMPRHTNANNYAQAMVSVSSAAEANRLIPLLQQRFDDLFPQAQVLVRKLEQGPPFNAPIEMRVYGPNLDQLKVLGEELQLLLSQTEDVLHTRATLQPATAKVLLTNQQEILLLTGLTPSELALHLQSNLQGVVKGVLVEATEQVPVRVRIGDSQRESVAVLNQLLLPGLTDEHGVGVRLSALSELQIEPSRGAIPHRNGQRVNVIEAYIRADVLPDKVLAEFEMLLANSDFTLANGYRLELGGESAERAAAIDDLMTYLSVIFVLLITIVVLLFNSFRLGSIILCVALQSAGLGLLCIYLTGHAFGFNVVIGILGLAGLAINAAIVILAEFNSNTAAMAGVQREIIRCVTDCSRHISSTTITTVGGFMPLILAGGGFWPPFAITIAGGTVLATLLSFYFVPAVFVLTRRHIALEPITSIN